MRFELRQAAGWLREEGGRFRISHWELVRLQSDRGLREIFYWGRKECRSLALALLGINGDVSVSSAGLRVALDAASVSDAPLPGSLRVPGYLRTVVSLGQPIDEITARYDPELRRRLRKRRSHFRMERVLKESELERVDREMLRPYATERQGKDAEQIPLDMVRDMSQRYGRLDLIYCDDEEVGCHLGHTLTRAEKRYWVTSRFGYPSAVFSDRKRLAEINSMTTYLALEFAMEQGFDYYDIGGSLARPDDGLLQWKRRRGGALDTMLNHTFMHVRLPKHGKAQFLWDAPLFALEKSGLSLSLGLPQGRTDEEAETRYREMGFYGLSKVYVHCARPAGAHFVELLNSRFAHQTAPPMVETILAD